MGLLGLTLPACRVVGYKPATRVTPGSGFSSVGR